MKFLSEKLNKAFDTTKELYEAEKEFDKKQKEQARLTEVKKARAKEVENAFNEYQEVIKQSYDNIKKAEDKYNNLKDQFAKDYNGYHMTYINKDGKKAVTFTDVFDDVFDNFFKVFF